MSPATRAAVTHTATMMLRLIRRPRGSGKASTLSGDVPAGLSCGVAFGAVPFDCLALAGVTFGVFPLGFLSFGVLPCALTRAAPSGTPFGGVITAGLPPSAPAAGPPAAPPPAAPASRAAPA